MLNPKSADSSSIVYPPLSDKERLVGSWNSSADVLGDEDVDEERLLHPTPVKPKLMLQSPTSEILFSFLVSITTSCGGILMQERANSILSKLYTLNVIITLYICVA